MKTEAVVTNVEAVVIYKVQIPDFAEVVGVITRFLHLTILKKHKKSLVMLIENAGFVGQASCIIFLSEYIYVSEKTYIALFGES